MINAVLKKKTEIHLNEDTKTSSILGLMSLLPAELFWKLLKNSLSEPTNLPVSSGDLLNIEFWPHWYNNEKDTDITNSKLVEPDVYIEFENFNTIIEVKLDGNLQYENQWINQICAYQTNIKSSKPLVYIALGGNKSLETNTLTKGKVQGYHIYNCSWKRLLEVIHEQIDFLNSEPYKFDGQTLRILHRVEQAFSIYGERVTLWMESIPTHLTAIDNSYIKEIRRLWRIK